MQSQHINHLRIDVPVIFVSLLCTTNCIPFKQHKKKTKSRSQNCVWTLILKYAGSSSLPPFTKPASTRPTIRTAALPNKSHPARSANIQAANIPTFTRQCLRYLSLRELLTYAVSSASRDWRTSGHLLNRLGAVCMRCDCVLVRNSCKPLGIK